MNIFNLFRSKAKSPVQPDSPVFRAPYREIFELREKNKVREMEISKRYPVGFEFYQYLGRVMRVVDHRFSAIGWDQPATPFQLVCRYADDKGEVREILFSLADIEAHMTDLDAEKKIWSAQK